MSISTLSKMIFLAALLLAPLSAEETNESLNCDNNYNLCAEKCEQSEKPSSGCFNKCDDEYDKCLASIEEEKKDSDK